MVMSTAQQQAFERALEDYAGFMSIEASLSRVDVRQPHPGEPEPRSVSDWQADCRNAKDKADILDELEKGVGFDKCNRLVVGLLREALVAHGWALLGLMTAAERRGNKLLVLM
eukprot:scaffold93921_cov38-Phaeocystis_antarctica.AAC.1